MKRVLAMSSVDPEELNKQIEERKKKDAEAKAQEKQKEDVKRHEEEAKKLYDFYGYDEKSIDKHAYIITIGRYKSEQNKKKFEKLKLDLKNKQNNKRAEIAKAGLSEKKIKQKNIEIAELEIRILYCNSKIDDAQTHYELFDKINTKATLNPTPKILDILKNQTVRINNAIQTQRGLLKTFEKNALAFAKAERSLSAEHLELANNLLTKSPREAIEDIKNSIGGRGKKAIKEKNAVLAYIQCERNKRDSEIDYQFSRKIFENSVRDASKEADATKELKEQLASLTTAINEREGYKKDLVATEAKKLENFNTLILLATEIEAITENIRKLSDKDKNEKLAELKQRLEALHLEDKQLNRQIDDANRLYSLSNYLIAEAAKDGDAKKLAAKLKDLKVAANRQKIYRKKLEAVERKILKTNTNKPKTKNDNERNELKKTQLTREKEDAELAHSMMTAFIEDAEKAERADNENADTDPDKKTNFEILKEQANQLREGIGGRRKYRKNVVFGQTKNRLALEEAENKHLEIEIKRKENKQRLDDPKFNQEKEDLKSLQKARNENKTGLESVILNRMSLRAIHEIGQLSLKDATLSLQEQQASRRVANAAQDHAIGRAFLTQAKADKNPSNLQSQFALMEITVAVRNVLTRQLEEEETRQLKKKNELQKAEFDVIEHKKKLEIEKETLKDMARTKDASSPEFIAQQSAVYASESQLQYKEWELKKLQRRQAEEATFDDRRLANAMKNENEANRLLKIILSPKTKVTERENAQKELKELKNNIKKEKELEEKLAPPARVKEREQYRTRLEKAEERRLEYTKKMNMLAMKELKASIIVDKLAEKRKKLEAKDEQIKREEADAKLLYDFSAKLLQISIDDTSQENKNGAAKKLKAQFKELKTASKIQKNLSDRISAIDKKMNSSLYLSLNIKTIAQLQRQKNDLIFGHTETQKLIQTAFDKKPPDPKGLAKDCKNLSAGIGGYSVFKGGLFGQERNREALDKYESLDSKNEKNLIESNIRLTAADAVKNEHPKRYKRALENHEDCTLLKEQSRRRLLDAKNDYDMGSRLLKRAVADEPQKPTKAERLALLKKQFAVLKVSIKARNKLVKRLEKIEKNAKKTERKDAKNIKKAEDRKESIEKDLKKANDTLTKLKETNPQIPYAINKQEEKIERLQEKLANQTAKIKFLKDKANGKKIRNDGLIARAKEFCNDANTPIKTVLGSTDEKAAKDRFTFIQDQANSADKTYKQERKSQNESYNTKIEEAKAYNKGKRQAKAVARKKKLAEAKQAAADAKAADANQGKTAPGTAATPAAATTAPTAKAGATSVSKKAKTRVTALGNKMAAGVKKAHKGAKKAHEDAKALAAAAKEGAEKLSDKVSERAGEFKKQATATGQRVKARTQTAAQNAKQGITKYAVKLSNPMLKRIQRRKARAATAPAAPKPPTPKTPAAPHSDSLNSISAPVHTSAAERAPSTVTKETNGRYIMEPKLDKGKPTKDFILYEVEPNSNRKIKVADITFKADENTQKKMMTAKFNTPIKEDTIGDAIKVIASVAAQCQPNDTTLYAKKPSGITSTFSNSDYNALVTTNCNEQFEKKHSQERTPQSLPSIAKDNNTVTNTADLALKEEKPSAPQKLSMH